MTAIMDYLFGSSSTSSQLNMRLDMMRSAESVLISMAKKFAVNGPSFSSSDVMARKENTQIVDDYYEISTFDTSIPSTIVPLKSSTKENDDKDESNLIMHGVKVETKIKSSSTTSSWSLLSQTKASASPSPLVLLHGYANGSLYFYRNLFGLCSPQTFRSVYALDMLGWGLSSRPHFQLRDSGKDDDKGSVEIAEDFFCESLEAWRKSHKIEKMTLGGHSMGGYLSVAYAERYPERVDRLILISPVGVPHQRDEEKDISRDASLRFRVLFGFAKTMWKRGITPGSILRAMPESRGRAMVASYIENRLPAVTDPTEREALAEYLYTNTALPASGEYCLNRFLKPMAYAHKPAVDRIQNLNVSKVSFIYGESDWMDVTGGIEVQRLCQQRNMGQDTQAAPNVDVHVVRNAGHLLMLDNWKEFNSAVLKSAGLEKAEKWWWGGVGFGDETPRAHTVNTDAVNDRAGIRIGAS